MNIKSVAIGCDHAGFIHKDALIKWLKKQKIEVHDWGTFSEDSVDYPDFAHPVAAEVENQQADFGVLLCGSGNGVAMTANKHAKIRAALCWTKELATLARQHNDANILCIPARFVTKKRALKMLNAFLKSPFEGGRHERRLQKISPK